MEPVDCACTPEMPLHWVMFCKVGRPICAVLDDGASADRWLMPGC